MLTKSNNTEYAYYTPIHVKFDQDAFRLSCI